MPSPVPGPHRRYDPLTDEWVLVSPHRLDRPWQGQVEAPAPERKPRYDPDCYLCPGNARAGGKRNPHYTSTFTFDNDFPALLPDSPPGRHDDGGLLVAEGVSGICRVLCFSPRHDLTLADMEVEGIRRVVDAWADESTRLGGRADIRYVQVFENKGAMMGASNPHPHGQIWATSYLPHVPARKLASQGAYRRAHGRDLLGDYLDRETRAGDRLVCGNDEWLVLVPYWATWPYETMLVPRRRVPDMPALDPAHRDGLADILKRLNVRYENLFRAHFPYSMGFHPRPSDGEEHDEWRLHAVFYPPLLRSATIRKFFVGFELTCEPQRDLTPEAAAARLREVGERPWREGA